MEKAERSFKDRQHLMAAAADGDQGFERLLTELIRVLLVMHFKVFRAFPYFDRRQQNRNLPQQVANLTLMVIHLLSLARFGAPNMAVNIGLVVHGSNKNFPPRPMAAKPASPDRKSG